MNRLAFASLAATGLACCGTGASGATTLRVVEILKNGDAAPELPGLTISGSDLNQITLNESGEVALIAPVIGPGVTTSNNYALFAGDPFNLTFVAREGDQVPGADPGVRWWPNLNTIPFGQPVLADSGLLSVGGLILDGGALGSAIVSGAPATVTSLVHFDMPSDDPTGLTYGEINGLYGMSESGVVAYCASLIAGSNPGVWAKSASAIMRYAYQGDPVPTLPALSYNGPYSRWGGTVVMNDAGQAFFNAELAGPGVTGANLDLLVAGIPGAMSVVARQGDAAPGTGRTYGSFFGIEYSLRINDVGAVAFRTNLSSGQAIMAGPIGNVTKIAMQGEPAPGFSGGETFQFLGDPELAGNGHIFFRAQVNSGASGLYRWNGSTLELLYRSGDLVPVAGFPADTTFGWFLDSGRSRLVVNNRGDIVFAVSVSGTGLSGTPLLYRTAGGELLNIAINGRLISPTNAPPFNPTSILSGVGLGQPTYGGSPESGRPHSLNEQGVFAARIRENGVNIEHWLMFVPTTCDGDADLSGAVDIGDLNQVIGNFGNTGGPGIPGDTNLDGIVDINDLNQVLGNFGTSCT